MVEFPEKGHRIRCASSMFYICRSIPEEASHVSEGWLYKKGKIVHSCMEAEVVHSGHTERRKYNQLCTLVILMDQISHNYKLTVIIRA